MRIDAYEVLGELGRGGMGVVYRAKAPDGTVVAIKVLQKKDAETLARFQREQRLQASLGEAEGFVPLLAVGDSPRGPYIVMPFVTGGTLRKRLEQGPLWVEEAVELVSHVARSIARAHELGIVHRDLKPDNVLLGHEGLPLVADLGLAKHFDPDATGAKSVLLSVAQDMRGTPGYMAPEQMRDARAVGPPADVFSLGAILYECLAGEPAFLGTSFFEVLEKAESGEIPALRSRRTDVPRWLVSVVKRALSPDPARRYPDAAAFVRALEAGPPRKRAVQAVVALVLAGATGGAALLLKSRAQPAPPAATPIAATPTPMPAGASPVPSTPTPEEALAKAKALSGSDDHEGALRVLTAAIDRQPGRADLWAFRARVFGRKGDLQSVLADATRAIDLDPLLAEAWCIRALAWEHKRDFDSSFTDATRATELDPNNAMAWALRASALQARKEYSAAIADFEKAIALRPDGLEDRVNCGHARALAGDEAGAIRDWTKAIELDRTCALAWLNRGLARVRTEDRAGAIADLEEVVRLLPPTHEQAVAALEELRKLGARD